MTFPRLFIAALTWGSALFVPALSQAQTVETRGEDVYVNGEKRFRVVQTKKMNFLTTEMPHFSVYDPAGQERLKFESFKLLFPGTRSVIPTGNLINSSGKALTNFLAQDSLFTAKGYNKAYEQAFITKHKGYYDNPAGTTTDASGKPVRDRSKPADIQGDMVMQSGQLVGHVQTDSREQRCTSRFAGTDRKVLAIATYSCDLSKPANIDVTVAVEGKEDVKLNVYYLARVEQEVANYLIKLGLL